MTSAGLIGTMATELMLGEDDDGNVIVILMTESGRETYAKMNKEVFRTVVEEFLK